MRSAGKPADPTIHPRTRPEAEDNAIKMRGTGDWFRHDGKNVEQPTVPAQRLQGHTAPEIAEKNKGEAEKWFKQDPDKPSTPKKQVYRCPTEESQKCKDKIYGREEAWFKMEENQDYHTPRPKSRMTTQAGQDVLDKIGHADTMDWFKHSHEGENNNYTSTPPKTRTGPLPYASENQDKVRPKDAKQPDWASHPQKKEEVNELAAEAEAHQPHARVNTADAHEYLERNQGSANDWFGHSDKVSGTPSPGKVNSKSSKESGNWFSHDQTNGDTPTQPKPRAMTESARNMVEKSRGADMSSILGGGGSDSTDGAPVRVKPEAQEIAKKSMEGIMSKYLNQEENKGYQSNRPAGRVVKPEAQEVAAKNKGVMAETMQGHPMGGQRNYSGARVVKSEAASNAERNKGSSMSSIFGGGSDNNYQSPAPRKGGYGAKHQGQGMSGIMGGVASMDVSDQPKQRCGSASAKAAAERNRGTLGDMFK